jgi:hypothetical protein
MSWLFVEEMASALRLPRYGLPFCLEDLLGLTWLGWSSGTEPLGELLLRLLSFFILANRARKVKDFRNHFALKEKRRRTAKSGFAIRPTALPRLSP